MSCSIKADNSKISTIVNNYLNPQDEGDNLSLKRAMINIFFSQVVHRTLGMPDHLLGRHSFIMGRSFQLRPTKRAADVQDWLFLNSTLPLYRGLDFSQREVRILIIGLVGKDGMGDFYHMLHAAEVLQKTFAKAKITIGAEVEFLSKRRNKFPTTSFDTILWGIFEKPSDRYIRVESEKDDAERDRCIKVALGAELVLELPHVLWRNSLAFESKIDVSRRIKEYGANSHQSKWIYLPDSISMGVAPLESGLIWKYIPVQGVEIAKLTDEALRNCLFEKALLPSTCKDLEGDYHRTHNLHFGHLRDSAQFVELSLAFNQPFCTKPVIDIVAQEAFYTAERLQKQGALTGIKEVQFFNKNSNRELVKTHADTLQETGKTVRLINPFPLSNKDVLTLMALSSGCTGSTGDLSLSELFSMSLANGKVPFYETLLHKMDFWRSFVALAKEIFGPSDSLLVQYFTFILEGKPRFEELLKIGELLHNPQLSREMRFFVQFLHEYYNFNETLIDIAVRGLAHHYFPQLRLQEEELFDAFQKGQETIQGGCEKLRKQIESLT